MSSCRLKREKMFNWNIFGFLIQASILSIPESGLEITKSKWSEVHYLRCVLDYFQREIHSTQWHIVTGCIVVPSGLFLTILLFLSHNFFFIFCYFFSAAEWIRNMSCSRSSRPLERYFDAKMAKHCALRLCLSFSLCSLALLFSHCAL